MRQLRTQSFLNTPEEFKKQFQERKGKRDAMDILRWEQLIKYYKGGALMDLGCLDSLIPIWAKQKYPKDEIWALDQSEQIIKELQEAMPQINYTVGDVYETTFPDGYFDYVVAGEIIEHLERPKDFIKEVFRILKRGGIFALTTPREETEAGEVDHLRHLWSFSKRDIKELIELYASKIKVGEIPSWLRRRIKYAHPYIICWAWKK